MSRLRSFFKFEACRFISALCAVALSLCASVDGSARNAVSGDNPVYRRGESMMERVLLAVVR